MLDLSKENTDRKAHEYEIAVLKGKLLENPTKEERKKIKNRIYVLNRKIKECIMKRDYWNEYEEVDGKLVVEHKRRSGVDIVDRKLEKGKYGKTYTRTFSRAMTMEEHQEYLKRKKKK
jgi:hypothetical protein